MIEKPLKFAGYNTKQSVRRESSGKSYLIDIRAYRRDISDVKRVHRNK